MKKSSLELFIHLLSLLSFLPLASCRTWKATPTEIVRDSVVIRTEYIERIDTGYIYIDREVQQSIGKDTTSTLENRFCISKAGITEDGSLFHSLETKPGNLPIPYKRTESRRDSIIYRDKEVQLPAPPPVVIEKQLTRWQQARLRGFWYLLAAAVMMAGWMCRKPLTKLFLRIIRK